MSHNEITRIDRRGRKVVRAVPPQPNPDTPINFTNITMALIGVLVLGALFAAIKGNFIEYITAIRTVIENCYMVVLTVIALLILNLDKLWPYALFGTLSLTASLALYLDHRRSRLALRITDISNFGIRLGRLSTNMRSYFIHWRDIEAIEQLNEKNKLLIATEDTIFELSLSNAFSWIDEAEFYVHVKTDAPGATISGVPSRRQISQSDNDVRYTDLWLQYFSTPGNRIRKGELSTGELLNDGRYSIVKKLSRGGQGTVYLASKSRAEGGAAFADSGRSELVALKEYILSTHRGALLEDWQASSLREEAEVLSRISHPQIVKLLDQFVEDHRGYLVLEYLPGKSLRRLVEEEGAQSEKTVLLWAIELCGILSYLHTLDPPVIHRDCTPDNIILCTDSTLKVIDFTIAHQLGSSRTATIGGKQAYTPPEQFEGKTEPQNDIYALGATLCFLLTGEDPEPMTECHPREKRNSISKGMDAIVARATSLGDRYSSAAEMELELRSIEHSV